MARPDWLVPGARVAMMRTVGHHARARTTITETTIDRVLKRDVVLANGERCNADSLKWSHGSWSNSTYLVSLDDPQLARAKRVNAELNVADGIRRHLASIETKVKGWADSGEPERLAEIRGHVDHLARMLDAVPKRLKTTPE